MTKEDLKKLHENRMDLYRLKEDIALLESAAQGLPPQLNGGGTGGTPKIPDKMAELISEALDKRMELLIKCIDYQNAIDMFESALEHLSTPERLIITLRYLDGLTWKMVEERSNYSYTQMWRLHNTALEKMVQNGT